MLAMLKTSFERIKKNLNCEMCYILIWAHYLFNKHMNTPISQYRITEISVLCVYVFITCVRLWHSYATSLSPFLLSDVEMGSSTDYPAGAARK